MTKELENDIFDMINEKFDTDLDDMMVCYQTGGSSPGSSFGLPTPKTFRE